MTTEPLEDLRSQNDLLIQAAARRSDAGPAKITGDILLVDDDSNVRETLSAVLARDGHRVTAASDLSGALHALDDGHFDLLVVDVRLGGQSSGLDVLKRARTRDANVVGIIITGYATLESAIEALKGGAFSYLLKPCDIADLRQAIAAGLHQRALAEATRLAAQAARERSARRVAQRAVRRVARLQELTAQLSTSLSSTEVLDQVVRAAVELLESPTSGVFLREGEHDDFHLAASQGIDREQVTRIPGVRSLAARAAAERQTVALDDVRHVPDIQLPALLGGKHVGALVVAPIMTHRAVLGVIEVYAPRRHRWQPDEMELLGALASAAAVALDNARLYEEMQQAVLTRDHVMATVSHDLKNPIAAISGNLQMLQVRLDRDSSLLTPAVLKTELERVRRLALNMSGFLDDLVETIRLEMGREVELRLAKVDLAELVTEVAAIMEPTTDRHRIVVQIKDSVVGEWDGNRLQRVVLNLLANAVKYSPDGGDIEVRVEQEDDHAVLAVTDHGIGISQQDVAKIFEPFRRGTNVGDISGTGLGLAGARRIVAIHRGTLTVESAEGQGATFVVRLPLAAS